MSTPSLVVLLTVAVLDATTLDGLCCGLKCFVWHHVLILMDFTPTDVTTSPRPSVDRLGELQNHRTQNRHYREQQMATLAFQIPC